MPSLIQDLGAAYVSDQFHGALFEHDNKICSFYTASDAYCLVNAYNKSADDGDRSREVRIPSEQIKDFSFFKYPKLGYRNIKHPIHGQTDVVWLSLRRSTKRGLHMANMLCDTVSPNFTPNPSAWEYMESLSKIRSIFNPTFPTFREALAALLEGSSVGAALSPDVAVLLATDRSPESEYIIMFRGRVVGTISTDGAVDLSNKAARRGSIVSLLEM